jgi:putative component of toxin-antitoxin plasmid stabilization module
VLDVREYIDTAGRSPFTKWLRALNVHAAAKVATALGRVAGGTKKRQQEDIRQAKANWEDYRNRKT